MHARWAIADRNDMSKSSEFLNIFTKAEEVLKLLDKLSAEFACRTGVTVPQTLRNEATQLILRFSTVRGNFVASTVANGLKVRGLRFLHHEFKIVDRVYAHDCATLDGFLVNVWNQVATSMMYADCSAQEDYCSKVYLCV